MSQASAPPTELVRKEALTWPERARELVVTTDEEYVAGGELLKDIKALRGQVNAAFDPIIKAAHETHKRAVASKKEVEAPLEQAERLIKGSMGEWAAEKERRRLEAQRQAAEEARKAQEALERAESLKTKAAQERAQAEAQAALERVEKAQAVADEAAKPKAAGVSAGKTWSAEVYDLRALVKHVAANVAFIGLLQPNETALNALARAQKEGFDMPGVRAVSKSRVSVR